ncbi:hypothetical protein K402DRAFT_358093 [Aulographum hederae CBS 113979]|uniref:3-hydroxyisobutyrate dehydrogenase n=1 Tax=Aulographum hederae CBS 113979 TaxID=1176131 RepID=A0A6G1GWB4_9PEZI|nr:hypothetical protein K402DRAFT_358093 [Aulographum hederae CBS 113979]
MKTVCRFAASMSRLALTGNAAARRRCFSSTSAAQATWGFIGLGRMGYPMAKNLRAKLPKEDTLFIQDVNKDAMDAFAAEISETATGKVELAATPRQVAENAETIITALPNPAIVKSVYEFMITPASLTKGQISQPRFFIDASTIDIITSREVSESITSSGQGTFVDAPMSGGVVGAAAGTLTFMIGSPSNSVDRATEALLLMGRKVLHLGEQGAGLAGKLANNYLLALNNVATAEAMNMGIKWGLDPKALAGMINISTGRCWPSEVNNPVPGVIPTSPASRGYEGGFGVALANKDLKLAIKAAEEAGLKLPMGKTAADLYDAVEKDVSCKGKDFSVVYRYLGGKE